MYGSTNQIFLCQFRKWYKIPNCSGYFHSAISHILRLKHFLVKPNDKETKKLVQSKTILSLIIINGPSFVLLLPVDHLLSSFSQLILHYLVPFWFITFFVEKCPSVVSSELERSFITPKCPQRAGCLVRICFAK